MASDCGVEYVILAPWQCADVGKDLDRPGWVELGNGKRIVVFFYNQILSTRVSFDPGATRNADEFLVNAVLPEISNGSDKSREKYLIIASDGELYGHHQRFRDQFLMRLTTNAFKGKPIELMTPAAWLKKFPPTQTFKIVENSSWSCHHGVLRWSKDCGCTPHSFWKAPLRSALNMVAEVVDHAYEQTIESCGADPSELLDDYVQVLLGRISHHDYVSEKISLDRNKAEYRNAVHILRAQYERQRMFTSCGWFFDDFDRIEPRNNVKYAAQAIWLTQQVKSDLVLDEILKELGTVASTRTNLRADRV